MVTEESSDIVLEQDLNSSTIEPPKPTGDTGSRHPTVCVHSFLRSARVCRGGGIPGFHLPRHILPVLRCHSNHHYRKRGDAISLQYSATLHPADRLPASSSPYYHSRHMLLLLDKPTLQGKILKLR